MESEDWVGALGRYAERVHARAGDGHHVVSPLGAWLLVALCATAAQSDSSRRELAEPLGGDPRSAASFAGRLLSYPHPLVGAGAGLWVRPAFATPGFKQWEKSLPAVLDTGDIPGPDALDAWARERTLGLIERFPVAVSPDVACLLASALATKVSWEVPFEVVDAAALGPSPWTALVRRALRARGDPRHRQFISDSERAGRVAVHLTTARGGLLVGSVIAADGAVPAADVLAGAEEIVVTEARQRGRAPRRSLFELDLGDGPTWSISERPVDATTAPEGLEEHVVSVLPAWSARTLVDLDAENLGFPEVARVLGGILDTDHLGFAAKQSTVARYSAVGFEAAAITVLAATMAAPAKRAGRRRDATVRFGHPFAVVAATFDDPRSGRAGSAPSPWHGVPVFSAWVTEPAEAESGA